MSGPATRSESPQQDALTRFAAAVADDIDMLSALHAEDLTAPRIGQLKGLAFPANLGLATNEGNLREAAELMSRALAEMPDRPDQAAVDELAADFAAIYLNNTYRASPTESVWLDDDGLAFQQPMFQVRAWYRRFDLSVTNWRMRSDDHLVMQLQFVAFLCRRAGSVQDLDDIARFLDEHLLRWLMDFALRVASHCDSSFYAGLCLLSAAYTDRLRDIIAAVSGQPRPGRQEIEGRMSRQPQAAEVKVGFMPGVGPSW